MIAVEELKRLSKIVPDWNWARTAIIAREWKYLEPVRSYAEDQGIPVQSANEELPTFWRFRETQSLVSWLRDRETSGLRAFDLRGWIDEQPEGPWWSVLRDGIEEFAREVGDRDTDHKDVLEWIAEWGREVRRRQSGLLLLTAHRAKGLEFDDVVVLDGGWDRASAEEDTDAARRLYYVAMTRARRSLSVLSLGKRHPMLGDTDDPSLLVRPPAKRMIDVSACSKVYQPLTLSDVYLDYAGRLSLGHPTLMALEGVAAGDPVRLKRSSDHWLVESTEGVALGRLAKSYCPPTDAEFVEGTVAAVVLRTREDCAEDWRPGLRREEWAVVVPELVFLRQRYAPRESRH